MIPNRKLEVSRDLGPEEIKKVSDELKKAWVFSKLGLGGKYVLDYNNV